MSNRDLLALDVTEAPSHDEAAAAFRWQVPERFNIGVDVCDRWAEQEPDRIALIDIGEDGASREISFGALRDQSNRMANVLARAGIRAGDRAAVLLPQRWETAAAHIALYKLGTIVVPLSIRFGPDALKIRMGDSGCCAVITDVARSKLIAGICDRLPGLENRFALDGESSDSVDLVRASEQASREFMPVKTKADDPAMIVYTSGTTGPPKGVVHAHRVLLGHLPGMEMAFDLFPQAGDRMWSPADWSWVGGLLVVLLPALHHGVPVVARRGGPLTGAALFDFLARHNIRNALLPPAALRLMRTVDAPEKRWKLSLRSVTAGGESLTPDLFYWARKSLGLTVNESYGQTECNLTIAGCDALGTAQAGWIGRQTPGHRVAIVDQGGRVLPTGEVGTIAVHRSDPCLFLGYWNNPQATREKFIGDWMVTGDIGVQDQSGRFRFLGRADDIITSAGHRIGPGEIETCLASHPAVQQAAIVGVADPLRGQAVKAFVVLAKGVDPSDRLKRQLMTHVRERLAPHLCPRRIVFTDGLPMTESGKVLRRKLRCRRG